MPAEAAAAAHGEKIGIYAARLLDDPLPWTKMRTVYRLLGLVRRYGAGLVDTACSTSLPMDLASVAKMDAMLIKALEKPDEELPAAAGHPAGGPGLGNTRRMQLGRKRIPPRAWWFLPALARRGPLVPVRRVESPQFQVPSAFHQCVDPGVDVILRLGEGRHRCHLLK
jgi:hypothetical protein